MAEVIRNDTMSGGQYPGGPQGGDPLAELHRLGQLEALPPGDSESRSAGNATLNRSAEMVGRSVGTAVAGIRSLPDQFDRLRSRIHLVKKNAGESAAELRDSAEAKAAEWRDAAEVGLLELADKAAAYTETIRSRADSRMEEVRRNAWYRLNEIRRTTRLRMVQAREWKPERPLQVIMICAGAAFALGAILRIWRSSSE
jgi:ElaB/YqjD/DUF883 family membrane-anchored ribosome-binding protein